MPGPIMAAQSIHWEEGEKRCFTAKIEVKKGQHWILEFLEHWAIEGVPGEKNGQKRKNKP